jgi:hypothetical protein
VIIIRFRPGTSWSGKRKEQQKTNCFLLLFLPRSLQHHPVGKQDGVFIFLFPPRVLSGTAKHNEKSILEVKEKGERNMKKTYFTVTGLNHYFGTDVFRRHQKITLKKDKKNEYDHEAIAVTLPGLGLVGFVANNPHTVLGESVSAGRLYDRFKNKAYGRVCYITEQGIICTFEKE